MKRVSLGVFALSTPCIAGTPSRSMQFRYAASDTKNTRSATNSSGTLRLPNRELGDFSVGGNTFYFGDSKSTLLKNGSGGSKDASVQDAPSYQHAQINEPKVIKSNKNTVSEFGGAKCIDGGVRISKNQQKKFERQQTKREKEQNQSLNNNNKKTGTQKKRKAGSELKKKKAATVHMKKTDDERVSATDTGKPQVEELWGNTEPAVPPYGLTRDSLASVASVNASDVLSASMSKFSDVTTLVADKFITFRAKAARAICPTPEQLVVASAHEVERKQLKAAKAFVALQEREVLQNQLRVDMQRHVEVYPNITTSITGFGLLGRTIAEPCQEYEIPSVDINDPSLMDKSSQPNADLGKPKTEPTSARS